MYEIEVDKNKKLVKMQLGGVIGLDEAKKFHDEILNILKQFNPNELLVLGDVTELKPLTAEVGSCLQDAQAALAKYCKKFAAIHKNAVTQLQTKRLAEEAHSNEKVKRFSSIEEGIKYLLE